MVRTGIPRRPALSVVCAAAALAATTCAMALASSSAAAARPKRPGLSTHSASTRTKNSAGELVATAKCGPKQHVVSGGFKGPTGSVAAASAAVGAHSWTVHLYPGTAGRLTTYAYCAHKGRISTHKAQGTVVAAPANTVVAARCASHEALASGGYAYESAFKQPDSPTYRDYASTPHAWAVMAAIETTPAELHVFAYCERGVAITVRSGSSGSIPGDASGSATASCHKGETLLGGGYTTTPLPDWNNMIGPDFFYSASYRSGVRSWTASARNYSEVNSMTAGTITAFAYCAS